MQRCIYQIELSWQFIVLSTFRQTLNIVFNKKMINDNYKYQTQNKPLHQTPIWHEWVTNAFQRSPINKINPLISSNKAPQQQQNFQSLHQSIYFSQQNINSSQEENALKINPPNYSIYALNQSSSADEQQKIIVSRPQLISFTQQFARQKINLENQIKNLIHQNQQLRKYTNPQQNSIQQVKTQIQKKAEELNNSADIKHQKELNDIKKIFKQQATKLRQEINCQKAKNFEINKKNEFLQEKLKYQNEQIQRFQNLLKIKEDIIQNFQWQKSINSGRNNENNKKQRSRSKQQFDYNLNKSINDKKQIFIKTQVNQTLDLSQIRLNHNYSNFDMLQKQQNERISNKKDKKYSISKKQPQRSNQQKVKLNISLQKNSSSKKQLIQNINQTSNMLEKGKTKSIIIKRSIQNSNSGTSLVKDQQKEFTREIITLQQRIKYLQKQLIQKQSLLSTMFKQNQILKQKIPSVQSRTIGEFSSIDRNLTKQIENSLMIQDTQSKAQLQKRNNMLKQKCILLQNQIQKTIRKYITLQERNQYLERVMDQMNNRNKNQINDQNKQGNIIQEEMQQINKPFALKDLATPQFRQTGFKANFFIKNKQHQQISQPFHNIQIKGNQKSIVLDTFERNSNIYESDRNYSNSNNRLEKQYQNRPITGFEVLDKRSIQEVSQIFCNNQEEIAQEDFLGH